MASLSYEEAMGMGADAASGPAAAKPAAVKGTLSYEEAMGLPPAGPSEPGVLGFLGEGQSWKDMAKYAAGTVGQIGDMVVAGVRGAATIASAGSGLYAGATGSSSKEVSQTMLTAQEHFVPEALKTPFEKLLKALGPQAAQGYADNGIGWLMGHFGEAVLGASEKGEKATGVPSELTWRRRSLRTSGAWRRQLLGHEGRRRGLQPRKRRICVRRQIGRILRSRGRQVS